MITSAKSFLPFRGLVRTPSCSNQHLRGNEVAMAIKFVCTSLATDGTASEPAKTMHSHSDPDSFCVRNFSHLSTDNYIICFVSLRKNLPKLCILSQT